MFHGTEMMGEHKERFFRDRLGIWVLFANEERRWKMWKVFEFRQCPTTFGPVATKSIRIFQKIVPAHGEPQKPTTSEVELLDFLTTVRRRQCVCWRQCLRSQEANLKFLAVLKPYLTADARVDILACELVAGETGMKALIDSRFKGYSRFG